MTKLFSTIAVALLATSFVACGPSAEEKAKMEEAANVQVILSLLFYLLA